MCKRVRIIQRGTNREVVLNSCRWMLRMEKRRRTGFGESFGGEEENGRDQELVSNLSTWWKMEIISLQHCIGARLT